VAIWVVIFNVPFQASIGEQLGRNLFLFLLLGLLFWPMTYFSRAEREYILSFLYSGFQPQTR
jgi:hypothetical protein